MKRGIRIAGIALLALSIAFGATACGEKKTEEGTTPKTESLEKDKESAENEDPEKDKAQELVTFENKEKDFSVSIPARFELKDEVEMTDELVGRVYKFADGDETLEISDIDFPGVEVNEELIKEEMEMGSGLEVLRMDNVVVPEQGTYYGALVNDTSTKKFAFYHRIQKGDRIISFLQMRGVPYSIEEEAANKVMLNSIVFK